ncbi:hypothetical protein [Phenylobacterium sp.]|uniref:hypothetical protein n=1 Tax=Phenylobacterium sp. TaxID=1871053 RepID=UPI0035B1EC8C
MSGFYLHNLLRIAIVLVTAFAWFKGGPAERIGATVNLVGSLAVMFLVRAMQQEQIGLVLLGLDGALGLVFLALAVRYTSLWLGGAMLLQAAQFSLHAYYLVLERHVDLLFAVVNNVVSWGVLLAILIGTLVTWRGLGKREI